MASPVKDRWWLFSSEHAELRARAEGLRETADLVGEAPSEEIRGRVSDLYAFLSHELLPHISVEEDVLYRAIAREDALRGAQQTLHRDHTEIARLVRELAELRRKLEEDPLTGTTAKELRRVLYGLWTLLDVHMGKEEEVCLPALDRVLSEEQIRELTRDMEVFEAAEEAAW